VIILEGAGRVPANYEDLAARAHLSARPAELARAGEDVAKIAKHLNRSEGSTRNRALRLDIALAKARRLKI
jgi:hypothetical protein